MTIDPMSLTEQNRRELMLACGLVELDEDDRRLLDWLATWDQPTIGRLCHLFAKLKRP